MNIPLVRSPCLVVWDAEEVEILKSIMYLSCFTFLYD